MAKRYDLLVFDWDGTLMDSTSAIALALQAACRDLGMPVPEYAQATYVIGLGLTDALQHLVPNCTDEDCQRLVERYRHHFLMQDPHIALFPGVREMLSALKEQGFLLAVATGKARAGLNRMLENTALTNSFDATRCADESFSKPHPAMLLELVHELTVLPQRTLMIGDTTHDLLMAQNAGVSALAVSYGAHEHDDLQGGRPLGVVHSIAELHEWLMTNG